MEISIQVIDCFRESLPLTHNREMQVNETALEFRRWKKMQEKGVRIFPSHGSLLDRFIKLADPTAESSGSSEDFQAYENEYGVPAPSYWTAAIEDVVQRKAAAANSPGAAWFGRSWLLKDN